MRSLLHLLTTLFILSVSHVFGQNKADIITDNKNFRLEQNAEFKDTAQTPLTAEGLTTFKKLEFFPINCEYRVVAKLTRTPEESPFEMKRSKGNTGTYRKY
jgi:uncharacterized protein (DUF1684 family)